METIHEYKDVIIILGVCVVAWLFIMIITAPISDDDDTPDDMFNGNYA